MTPSCCKVGVIWHDPLGRLPTLQIGATLFTLLHPQSPSTPHIPTCHACTPAVHT